MESGHNAIWEHRRAELWDRIFQVTQDVVTLAETLQETPGTNVVREELVKAAMDVGKFLARATAAENEKYFRENLEEARLKAIEADYWLRLAYIVQQREEVQRDLSSIISQYVGIIDLIHKMGRHVSSAHDSSAHTHKPKISL